MSSSTQIISFLVVFGGGMGVLAYFLALRPWLGRRRCARELPRLLAERGFTYHPSRLIRGGGTYGGTVDGHHVWIDVDSGLVRVWLNAQHALDLEERAPQLHPRDGWVAFDSSSRALDGRFGTRYGTPEVAALLAAPSAEMERIDRAIPLLGRGHVKLSGAVLDHQPLPERFPDYLPTRTFARWFPAVVELAASVDRLLPGQPVGPRRACDRCGAVCEGYVDSDVFGSCRECGWEPPPAQPRASARAS